MNRSKILLYSIILLYISAVSAQAALQYDVNGNGKVDSGDLAIIRQHYNEVTSPPYQAYDVKADGVVDIHDAALVGQNIGETVPGNISSASNLLANPGFESGAAAPLNWTLVTNNGSTPLWDANVSHTGSRSIKIQVTGTQNNNSGYPKSDLIQLLPNTTYNFSAWGMTEGAGGTNAPAVRVVELDAGYNLLRETALVFDKGTNPWAQKSMFIETTANTSFAYVYMNIWNGYGTLWVDDVEVRGVAEVATIDILVSTAYLVEYQTQQFTAIGYDAKGNTTYIIPIWNSSNTTVGTIDILGLFTALKPGTTNITATSGAVSNNAVITVTEVNITAYCIGNCSNPENVLKDDGNYTRIYGDRNGTNAVVVDLGKEVSIANIGIKFYNNYSPQEYYNLDLGYFENFVSKPNNMTIYNSNTLPKKGIDYNIEYNGEEQIMWIKTDTANSTEYIVAKYTFDSMVDISKNPIISYKLRVSDESINSGFEYIDVSNGTNTIKIWNPDGQHNSTSWIERSFNAYDKAKSYGDYKYLKSYGLRLYNSSIYIKDNSTHFAYWDYMIFHDKDYQVYISSDKNSWELIDNNTMSVEPNHSNIIISNITSENSNFSKAKFIKIESIRKNIWIDNISVTEWPVTLISSSAKINHILVDTDSYMFVTPDTGKATFIFRTPVFKTLRVTDNTKVVIDYDNGNILKDNDWGMYFTNGSLTIEANLSEKHDYIMLDFNPAQESIKTGDYGLFRNQSDVDRFINSNLDWYWYQSEAKYAKKLTMAGKKVILNVRCWTNSSLVNKTWDDLYNSDTLMNICINDTIIKIDASGNDTIYAVSLGEEEPNAGYRWGLLGNINQTNYINGNNRIYTSLKIKYPSLKVFAGVHILSLSDNNLSYLKQDGILDDKYDSIPNMNTWFDKLSELQDRGVEIYAFIWASSNYTAGVGYDLYTPDYTEEIFRSAKNKGLKNIGFFANAFSYNTDSWIVSNDYTFNTSLSEWQRPELYKERIFKMVNKYSI